MSSTNKSNPIAPLQVSAEQILLEAYDRREQPLRNKKSKFSNLDELQDYQARKRREFEDALTRKRQDLPQWQRYARFELEQREYERARSVFERALDVNSTNVSLWLEYIQSELRERNINHARNLLDRAVTILPRVDKLWYTFVSVEETLSNFTGCRQVFERWMNWRPSSQAWIAYADFEKRYGEFENAREVFERLTSIEPTITDNWIKWAIFEDELGNKDNTRQVYENASEIMINQNQIDEKLIISWAKWESKQQEFERARSIYKLFLEKLSRSKAQNLFKEFTKFEKQCGDKEGLEDVILSRRRREYEDKLVKSPYDYDIWYSYLQLLEETAATKSELREVFERSIQKIPEIAEKSCWRRYIYLWIRYAVYEELSGDIERARSVYKKCLEIIPHDRFTFGKIWLLYAKFEIRNDNLNSARKILGQAIGKSQKASIYKAYINLEKQLREFDRCRKLYELCLQHHSELPSIWIEFASLEQELGEEDRARAIYKMAIDEEMEKPETIWKNYIDFEIEEGNYENSRELYENLLKRNNHVKIWIAFAMFELSLSEVEGSDDQQCIINSRSIFKRGWDDLKKKNQVQERLVLLDGWEQFESEYGDSKTQKDVEDKKPSIVKKRRILTDGSLEEYEDYVFPTDDADNTLGQNSKMSMLLQRAKDWKKANNN